ncbi:MAG: SEC-C metal-binding domain-containing protein, partial [Halanaerobiales bacterium]
SNHEETLVRKWAVEQLAKFYAADEEVQGRMFSLARECKGRDDLRIILQNYFEDNYHQISAEMFKENIEIVDDWLMEAILIENLARKNYNQEQVLNYIEDIFKQEGSPDGNVFLKLVSALGELRTSGAYNLLLQMREEMEIDFMFFTFYCDNIFKYKREQDIAGIFREVVTNIDKAGEANLEGILISYSELFYGREFSRYLIKICNEEELDRILHLLETYWSSNNGVMELYAQVFEIEEAYNNEEYDRVFAYLLEQLNGKFADKYSDFVGRGSLPLTIDKLISIKDSISEEDFWIGLAITVLQQEQHKICKQDDIESIINFMLSLLIVLLEDNDFANMITKAENNREDLWKAFTLDRGKVPEEIIEMIIEQGTVFEDRLIDLIKNNKYDNYVERTVRVLGEINSQKSIPYIINLLDRQQGDYINEQISTTLEGMYEFLSLEGLEEAVRNGDSTRRIFLTSFFGYFPCDESARILTDLWEEAVLDVYEQFVLTLKNIGSSVGLHYLNDIVEDDDMSYAFETLLVLAIINDSDKKTVDYYRRQIKKSNEERNIFKGIKRKYMQEEKRQALQSGQDEDFNQEKYFVNKDGTRIKKTDIGRNDPCPCGSGKKYKQCCGR